MCDENAVSRQVIPQEISCMGRVRVGRIFQMKHKNLKALNLTIRKNPFLSNIQQDFVWSVLTPLLELKKMW